MVRHHSSLALGPAPLLARRRRSPPAVSRSSTAPWGPPLTAAWARPCKSAATVTVSSGGGRFAPTPPPTSAILGLSGPPLHPPPPPRGTASPPPATPPRPAPP